ncbi:MAG: aldo/keto reductase [Pseudomonadota bacterium]
MHYVNFGNTGLQVSRICLGCMTYGEGGRGTHAWTLSEDESRPLIRQALEAGINFFDTANVYSDGSSEEIVGRALKDFAHRDEVVIATKAYGPWRNGPNAGGLSRKALFQAVDDSLKRLGTDYVDLLQIHRWDYNTPIEESMEALSDLVVSGRVRYLGASSMFAWQFMKALHVSALRGLKAFVSMQNHYNLIYREEEREMLPLCEDQGIAVMPWSPLARGILARPWNTETQRSQTDQYGSYLYSKTKESDEAVVGTVARLAEARGIPQAQLALAWLLSKPAVTTPIVGVGKQRHLDDAIAALDVQLSREDLDALEAPYVPHPVLGMAPRVRFSGRTTVRID